MAGKANEVWELEENHYFTLYINKGAFTTVRSSIHATPCVLQGLVLKLKKTKPGRNIFLAKPPYTSVKHASAFPILAAM